MVLFMFLNYSNDVKLFLQSLLKYNKLKKIESYIPKAVNCQFSENAITYLSKNDKKVNVLICFSALAFILV